MPIRLRSCDTEVSVLVAVFLLVLPAHAHGSGLVLSTPNFIVRYDSVDVVLARKVSEGAERSLTQVTSQLRHVLDVKTLIVIASSEQSFLKSVQGQTPEWGMAFAFAEENKVVMKSPRLLRKNIDVDGVITHELTHIVLNSLLKGHSIPLWLNEGVAMYQSREWEIGNSAVVGWAAVRNKLYALGELETHFPWSGEGARLAYAESFLAVAYIVQRFGREALVNLIHDLGAGVDIDVAMRKRFGVGYERFRRDWMTYTKERFSVLAFVINPATLWSAAIVLLVAVYIKKRKQRVKAMRGDVGYEERGSPENDDM
jgi:hypothetical protein